MDTTGMNQGYEPAPHTANRAGAGKAGRGRLFAGAAAAVLVGGASFGAVTMLSGPSSAAVPGPTGQAAVLNAALTTANTPAAPAGGKAIQRRHVRDALARLRRLGGIDGQFTFQTKAGPKTLAFERGTIASISGGDVVIRAKDGTTWSWTLVSDSVVRENGAKTTSGALSAGDPVFVGGPVVSGARDARLVVIRNPRKSSSPTTSPSTSTNASSTIS
jgi:hypothetical protein